MCAGSVIDLISQKLPQSGVVHVTMSLWDRWALFEEGRRLERWPTPRYCWSIRAIADSETSPVMKSLRHVKKLIPLKSATAWNGDDI